MLELSVIITIVPPIVTGVFAYMVARKKNIVAERINRARVDADVQTQALTIVRQVMNDMREDFQREMSVLKEENQNLKRQIDENKTHLESMQAQMEASDILIETLKSELSTLKKTLTIYEKEIERLRNGG